MHFTLPAGTTAIRLASPRRFHEVDTRQLGVAIQQIAIDDQPVPLEGPAIRTGFYRLEQGGAIAWRWTNSDALIEVPELPEQARMMVAIAPWSLPPPETGSGERRRAAVVCWDVGHNPVGRAHVLYRLLERDWNVELLGPAFRRFGTGLWPPLREKGIALRSFLAETLEDVWVQGSVLALSHRYDLVVVSKPRLPGLLLAEQSRCPLIVDADEAEIAFTAHHGAGTEPTRASLLAEPFGLLGTELAARLLSVADGRTASSPYLQMEHGGHLVRHARDEAAAVPSRAEARRRLGFTDSDFVIAFAGTIDPHKGQASVLAGIEAVADLALRLLLVGPVHDPGLRPLLAAQPAGRVVHHPGSNFADLGSYLAAADLVPLLQDPGTAIARSQFPAELADALQHGVPVVATGLPPLRDLARRGVVDLIQPQDFAGYLRAARAHPHSPDRAQAARRVFESEFGLEVNRARLDFAIDEAYRAFNPARPAASEALATLRRETRRARRSTFPTPALPVPAQPVQGLVFFWKQNDSGLFGRRSDMVVKYLQRSGRFRRVLHIDLPLHIFDLRNMARAHDQHRATKGALQVRGTIARALGLADEAGLHRAVMLTHSLANEAVLAGQPTHSPAAFAEFIQVRMREHGIEPRRALAWVCPVVRGFAEAAGRPVVSTPVANLDDVRDLVTVARDAPGFIAAVERQLACGEPPALPPARRAAMSWPGRVAVMLRLVEEALRAPRHEGERRERQPLRLVASNAGRQPDAGQPLQNVGAKIGLDQ